MAQLSYNFSMGGSAAFAKCLVDPGRHSRPNLVYPESQGLGDYVQAAKCAIKVKLAHFGGEIFQAILLKLAGWGEGKAYFLVLFSLGGQVTAHPLGGDGKGTLFHVDSFLYQAGFYPDPGDAACASDINNGFYCRRFPVGSQRFRVGVLLAASKAQQEIHFLFLELKRNITIDFGLFSGPFFNGVFGCTHAFFDRGDGAFHMGWLAGLGMGGICAYHCDDKHQTDGDCMSVL